MWTGPKRSKYVILDQKDFLNRKMNLGDKNIAEIIAKVIEEGKDIILLLRILLYIP